MALTQRYKQAQQQVRVHTNESNYLKGMYYSDTPLAEGYSKMLVNFDIDSMSGKISPRKGLQTLGLIKPHPNTRQFLNNASGFNNVVDSRVCAVSDSKDPRKVNRFLQTILYNTDTRSLLTSTCDSEIKADTVFKATPFSVDAEDEFIAPDPFVIEKPGVHGKQCIHNHFFKRPVGTFAFGGSYYTFLKHNKYNANKIADLPDANYINKDGEIIENATDLLENSTHTTGEPGGYFVFISGVSAGTIAYYDSDKSLKLWERSEEALLREKFADPVGVHSLCYTRLGIDIKNDAEIELLDPLLRREELLDDVYYVCIANPKRINPTEATSWGYNMLLEDPYDFKCETTAVNLVTILGVLPYDRDGKITLTPRKNQEITLKGYYRAPEKYFSDVNQPRFYATTKKQITVNEEITVYDTTEGPDGATIYKIKNDTENRKVYYGYIVQSSGDAAVRKVFYYVTTKDGKDQPIVVKDEDIVTKQETIIVTRDPKTEVELRANVTDLTDFSFGCWWYCSEENKYFMVIPDGDLATKKLDLYGTTQPAASVSLSIYPNDIPEATQAKGNEIRVKWEMRSSGAATWTELSNERYTLPDYFAAHGNYAPFTYTGTMPSDEVLIKLTITDPVDVEGEEEYVLSTNTIGLSLVSDELANTLNLTADSFDLGQCTGMCEWEQRLVVWGVPGALNTIFISDVGNPTFFPYPNNIDVFTEPVVTVHNYGNELLVLTTSALYRLVWDAEGTGWTHKLVQQNLHITEEDTYMSCVIKNMFFFKSGDYYYMMVPKTTSAASVRGETAIAPISKPIENLLDNFHEEVYNLVKVMVDTPDLTDFTDRLVNYFSYVDNTKVVVNYVYALDDTTAESLKQSNTDSKYLYVQLIYDTDARTWSMRIFEAAHMLYASHADAIQQDRFIDLTPALNGDQLVLQYYKLINIADDTVQYVTETGAAQTVSRLIKNYQYLDTGNREINTELKKRFREFQFKLKNNNATNLGFFTSFLIDGSLRKDLQRYSPRMLLDETTGEAVMVVERVLDPETMTYNTTRVERILVPERMLQDDGELTPTILAQETDADRWVLNQSAFPGRTLWKIRMPISGKGLSPRAILLSTNEADYEILGHSWVYRTMNGR